MRYNPALSVMLTPGAYTGGSAPYHSLTLDMGRIYDTATIILSTGTLSGHTSSAYYWFEFVESDAATLSGATDIVAVDAARFSQISGNSYTAPASPNAGEFMRVTSIGQMLKSYVFQVRASGSRRYLGIRMNKVGSPTSLTLACHAAVSSVRHRDGTY